MNRNLPKNENEVDMESKLTDSSDLDPRLTREEKAAPRLSHKRLTLMLSLMCLIPVITILVLWQYLPSVYEGQLKASVLTEGLPAKEFYATDYFERGNFEGGFLIVQNISDVDWTNLNIQVNGHYQIYDNEPILAGGEKRYQLSKFLNRTGARFSLQYNELNRVRIYARLPTRDRATFFQQFDTYAEAKTNWWPVAILLGTFAVLLGIAAKLFSGLYAANEKQNSIVSGIG